MSKSYQPWTQDQPYLLPPSLRDWLAEEHLAWFILDVVSQLDLGPVEAAIQGKDARGQRPYHPAMMVALLIYAYCTKVYSSRRIERACHEDVAFRVITGNAQPYFTTINEFRRVYREHLGDLFVEVLKLCRRAGLVKLRHVAIDGTKVKANASKHKAMSYKRMLSEERRLREEVERLLGEADAADAAEDERYGEGMGGDELPAELRRRESRLERIRQAKAELEAEARRARAKALREQAEGMDDTAESHPDEHTRRRLRTRAANSRARAEELDPPEDEPPGGGCGGGGELPRKPTQATPEGLPCEDAQRNFTDPDSSIMRGADGFIQAYNAQLAVDESHQVIVACAVTDQPPDNANFEPMLERVRHHLGEAPCHASGDAGYWHPEVEARAQALGTTAWVATERVRHGEVGRAGNTGEVPANLEPRARMRFRLDTPEGRALYARRKAVVEPVNGQIKHARGFRQFSVRGLPAVDAEWAFVSLCHNVLKLFIHREPSTATA
jgi:transposase